MIDSTMNPRPHAATAPPRPVTALRRWLLLACLCLGAVVLAPPGVARAQDEEIKQDARLEGYQGQVSASNQSTALMWLLFVLLAVIAVAVLFKDAKRTHLD
jgi:hypothetical protein